MEATYTYQDYWTKQRHTVRCEVIDRGSATVFIRLREYGPQGRPPGTTMRVRKKSVKLPGETTAMQKELDLSWHDWTDK